MPVRSLTSSVLKWPDQQEIHAVVQQWAEQCSQKHAGVLQIGYFGSYARGDWGVGSDLDLLVVVERSKQPFERRALAWDLSALPVPADLLIYTRSEWKTLQAQNKRFYETIRKEIVWVVKKEQIAFK